MEVRTPSTKVLVVDDDPGILRALARVLRRHHVVLEAADGAAALQQVSEHPDVAVIISDYAMPEMSGVELLREALVLVPDATRILMSGLGEMAAFREVIDECRLYTFVSKPFEIDALEVIVQRAADHHILVARNARLVAELGEQAAREKALRRAFQQYVPEEVVNDLVETRQPASVMGAEREVTVLLADLRGFTGLAEKRHPAEMVRLLNRFFAAMASPVLDHRGTIDKYIGDSILAHFGGMRPDPEAADNAVRAALAMRTALGALDRELAEEGSISLHFGVGINTGRCIIGNVGCSARMDYTIIGDAVNVAARVQELSKDKLDSILITESTRARLLRDVELAALPPASVRGRERAVGVYEVLGLPPHGRTEPPPPAL
jgi:adenylate cyclase